MPWSGRLGSTSRSCASIVESAVCGMACRCSRCPELRDRRRADDAAREPGARSTCPSARSSSSHASIASSTPLRGRRSGTADLIRGGLAGSVHEPIHSGVRLPGLVARPQERGTPAARRQQHPPSATTSIDRSSVHASGASGDQTRGARSTRSRSASKTSSRHAGAPHAGSRRHWSWACSRSPAGGGDDDAPDADAGRSGAPRCARLQRRVRR